MLASEVKKLVAGGEGQEVEFEEDFGSPESEKLAKKHSRELARELAKAIVAFANGQGGTILLGVTDDGKVSGIKRDNLQEWIMDTVIGQYMTPNIIPEYKEVELDAKLVAVLSVPRGSSKPYAVGLKNQAPHYYLRVGNTSRIADHLQMVRLFQSGKLVSVEKMPIHESSIEDLDMNRLHDYFINILGEEAVDDWVQTLLRRNLLVKIQHHNGDPCCSYASYILFANDPKLMLPQAGIRLLVYPGDQEGYDTHLDESLSAPFVGLKEKNEHQFIERSLPNLVLSYLQPHISKEGLVGMQRSRHWDYPVPVIRELIVNAFAHRDWTKQRNVCLTVFTDRMEISSPGALPNGITIDEIIAGQQEARNANIVRILRDYKFMEDKGMGIRRQVIPLMKEHNNTEPEFEATEHHFKVTLYRG